MGPTRVLFELAECQRYKMGGDGDEDDDEEKHNGFNKSQRAADHKRETVIEAMRRKERRQEGADPVDKNQT